MAEGCQLGSALGELLSCVLVISLGCVLDGCSLLGLDDGWEEGASEGCTLGIPDCCAEGWLLGTPLGPNDGSVEAMKDSEAEPVTVLPVAAAALSSKASVDAAVSTSEQLSTQVISVVTIASD